jgi:hypothetical protein
MNGARRKPEEGGFPGTRHEKALVLTLSFSAHVQVLL